MKNILISCLFICICFSILQASQFDPGEELYTKSSTLNIPPISKTPNIDGIISLDEWDIAAAVTGFHSYSNGQLINNGPVVFLAYNEANIYVLFMTPKPEGRELLGKCIIPDGPTYQDDAVEVFLQTSQNLYQIVVNSIGTVTDLKDNDPKWNGNFITKTSSIDSGKLPNWGLGGAYWFAEMAIPFSQLNTKPDEKQVWGINLAVDRAAPWASLAPLKGTGDFADTSLFSKLHFMSNSDPYAQITSLGNIRFGEFDIRGILFNPGPSAINMNVQFDVRKKGSTVTDDAYRNVVGIIHTENETFSVAPGANIPISIKKSYPETEANQFAFAISSTEPETKKSQDLLTRQGILKIEPPLNLSVGNIPSNNCISLKIDTSGLIEKIKDKCIIKINVQQTNTNVLPEKSFETLPGISETIIDYNILSVGTYRCLVGIHKQDGTVLAQTETTFNKVASPEWLKSSIYDEYGQVDRVPLPWKSVEESNDGKTIQVWGRKMDWETGSILPASITSQNIELLTKPIKFILKINDKDYVIPCQKFAITEKQNKRISLKSEGCIQGLTVSANMWVEYDGFLWVDLTTSGGTINGTARIEIQMPADKATLYQTFNRPQTGWIEDKTIELPWIANESIVNFYHWLGNEDVGLGFTYTSLEHWMPSSENNYATITQSKESVKYTINLIEKPASLANRNFRFGIQATPIKPLPSDYHSMLSDTLNHESWKAWQQIPENIDMLLVWPLETGIMKGLNNPYNVNAESMKASIAKAHEKHVGMVTVAACPQKISPLSEGFDDWLLEWQTIPTSILNWDNVPHYQDCGASYTFRKWLFYGWAIENVKKFNTDGVYFDGWQAGQMGCSNPHHGCGWTDSNGKRKLTVPVLEGREFNQRMILFLEDNVKSEYALAKTAPAREGFPKYHYWIHSWEFVPSVMGFATEWLSGEFAGWPLQGTGMLKPEGTLGGCVGLGLLRTRCLSTNWGVPNMFLPLMWENTENPSTDKQTLNTYAWLLPHGIPLGGNLGYMNHNTTVEISKIFMQFDSRNSEFIPAWKNNPYFSIEKPKIKEVLVATWAHPKKNKVLAVVSNLMVNKTEDITLSWKGLADAKFKNARTGEVIESVDGKICISLKPESFILISAE